MQANDIQSLQNLLLLNIDYCQRYNVTLVPEKTKLLAFSPPGCEQLVDYAKIISPININGRFSPSQIPLNMLVLSVASTVMAPTFLLASLPTGEQSFLSSPLALQGVTEATLQLVSELRDSMAFLSSSLAWLLLSFPPQMSPSSLVISSSTWSAS